MATQTEQRMMLCPTENRPTLHYRNVTKRNWVLHFVLALLTSGFWLIVMLFLALSSGKKEPWTCSQCGLMTK